MQSADLPRPEITIPENPPQHEIFKEGQPLRYLGNLGEGITGETFAVIFDSSEVNPMVSGLGRWVQQSRLLEHRMKSQQGSWVENPIKKPQENPYAAIKVSKPNSGAEGQISVERAILEDLNETFSKTDKNRPVRLYGYGVTKNEWGWEVPYLITELVPERFRLVSSLSGYTEADVINLAAGVSEILARMHYKGIVQMDDANLLNNLFYDPATKETRMIDFGNGYIQELAVNQKLDYAADRSGLGKMMYKLLTGKDYISTVPQTEFQAALVHCSPETREIVGRLLLRDSKQAYPARGGKEVTIKVYNDLQELQKNFSSHLQEKKSAEAQSGVYVRDPEKATRLIDQLNQQSSDLARRIQIIQGALSTSISFAGATDEERSIYAQFIGGKTPEIKSTIDCFQETHKVFVARIRILSIVPDQQYQEEISRVEDFQSKAQEVAANNRAWLEYYRQHGQLDTPEARKAQSNLAVSQNNSRVYGLIIADKEFVSK